MSIDCEKHRQHRLSASALAAFMDAIEEQQLSVNSFMLLHDGTCALQWVRDPYRSECPQLLYSLSKTVTSIAVGIAWDRGLLGLEDPVVSFFPDKLPPCVSPNLSRMTVHHLLSMTAGHEDNIYSAVAQENDWAAAFLAQDVPHVPGQRYRYSTHSTYMLSAILERVAGCSLVDFLMPVLFEPLSIPRPSWETCPLGITAGGMGLSLTTSSVAKIGMLLMNNGMYEGQRIVSERYIQLATSEQSDNRAEAAPGRIDSAQGYGYQIHLCRRGCYRGDGSFGQLCFVAPKERIVIAATSSFRSMSELQQLLNLIYTYILAPNDSDNEETNDSGNQELQRRMNDMSRPVGWAKPIPVRRPRLDGGSFRLSANPHGLQRIRFDEQDGLIELHMDYGNGRDNMLPFSYTEPLGTFDVFYKDLRLHRQEAVTYASWLNNHTLELSLVYIETPYIVTYLIVFAEDDIELHFSINVSLNIPAYRATGVRID